MLRRSTTRSARRKSGRLSGEAGTRDGGEPMLLVQIEVLLWLQELWLVTVSIEAVVSFQSSKDPRNRFVSCASPRPSPRWYVRPTLAPALTPCPAAARSSELRRRKADGTSPAPSAPAPSSFLHTRHRDTHALAPNTRAGPRGSTNAHSQLVELKNGETFNGRTSLSPRRIRTDSSRSHRPSLLPRAGPLLHALSAQR